MSIEYYRGMLIQTTRMEAFRKRILEVVRPGDNVLEIGSGLGTYSMFAAEAGAKKVWAVEGAPVIAVAKAIAKLNGYADRIEFIRGWFPAVSIPEPIDVLIFEDFPPRLLDDATYDLLERLHADIVGPQTRVVPDRARMFLAPVLAGESWPVVGAFTEEANRAYGIDWSPTREYITNKPLQQIPVSANDLRGEPRQIADVHLDVSPDASSLGGHASWTFEQDTTINGLSYWFELEVGDGVWLTNAPGGDPGSWGNVYLPTADPMTVKGGMTLTARVTPLVRGDGAPTWLTWEVSAGETTYQGHEFKSFPATISDIIHSSPSWIPELSDEGRIEQQIMALADGTRSVQEIAEQVRGTNDAWPMKDALQHVVGILAGRTKQRPRAATS